MPYTRLESGEREISKSMEMELEEKGRAYVDGVLETNMWSS